jgi:kynurenine formamidase
MIYNLSQPIFNNVPQWPKFGPTSMTVPHLTAIESMLDGRERHFAAFPVLIEKAGEAWTRAVAWDEGEMA